MWRACGASIHDAISLATTGSPLREQGKPTPRQMAAGVAPVLSKRGERMGTSEPEQDMLPAGFQKAYANPFSKENPQVRRYDTQLSYHSLMVACIPRSHRVGYYWWYR